MLVRRSPASPLAVLIVIVTLLAGLVVSPAADAGALEHEQQFIQLINQTRAAAGVPPLTVHPELTIEARAWAQSMAASGTLAHAGDISKGITAPWTVLGENVGVHGVEDVPALHDAFVASPGHHQNLVDARFRHVGVGVVVTEEGKLWTTHRFMATAEPSTGPTTTTAPPTTVAPTTTAAAPTTVPPTTTPVSTTVAPATTATTATTTVPGSEPGSEPLEIGPGEPDTETVEQILLFLLEAGL